MMVVSVGDRDGERGAKTNAVLSTLDPVIGDLSIHEPLLAYDQRLDVGRRPDSPVLKKTQSER